MMPGYVQQRRLYIGLTQIVLLLPWLALSGCARFLPELEPYGAVSGVDANRSLNGLGVHRELWESAGARCLYPQKLSPRLDDIDVIVLAGKDYDPPGRIARRWLEDWLSQKKGRSVVYFGRDFNAAAYYRQQTLDALPPEDQPAGRRELAVLQTDELRKRIRQVPESTFCDWFYLDVRSQRKSYLSDELSGPWAAELASFEDESRESWPIGVTLRPPLEQYRENQPSWISKPPSRNVMQDFADDDQADSLIQRSVWRPNELATQEQWDEAFDQRMAAEVLLSTEDGRPCIFKIEDEDKFPDSQIMIVANGAPMLNGSLVVGLHRSIGARIVESCLPAKRVALLSYDEGGLLISRVPEPDNRGAGLEMLTVWPLSAITMPAALLGIVVCAALIPVLGRPQRLSETSSSDFGLHVEALGKMLQDSGDINYSKQAIREYFDKVKQESPPYWLVPESQTPASPPPMPADEPNQDKPSEQRQETGSGG